MAIIVPNAGSVYSSNACFPGSEDKWVWLGFATAIGASGCAVFYRTNASTSGCEMLAFTASPGFFSGMIGPFNSPCGFYIKAASGGCAMAWMKK